MENYYLYEIALTLIQELTPQKQRFLLDKAGKASEIFSKDFLNGVPEIKDSLVKKILNGNALKYAEKEIAKMEKYNITPVFINNSNYPKRLRFCQDAPIILYTKGKCDFNSKKIISIVGTRKCTQNGKSNTGELIKKLAGYFPDIIIVSGLAYGIDICSHRAALDNHLKTIAVLAHGLNKVYPAAHKKTAAEITDNGCLVSELKLFTESAPWRFVQRNRIIAGLCDACIVMESAEKGGSLITAEMASGYGRDVFAFPGRNTDKYSKGCNKIIKTQLATLIESAEDLAKAMGWRIKKKGVEQTLFPEMTESQKKIYEKMKPGEKYRTEELKTKEKKISDIISDLIIMEINKIIISLPGGYYSRLL